MLQSVQSPTLLSHTTLSQPFRIKSERYIFPKKCVRSSLLLIMFPHVYVYVLLYHGYTTYSNIKIGYNTEKSLGYETRLAVTQTPERTHRQTVL